MNHYCNECIEEGKNKQPFKTAAALGSHRKSAHGVAGSSSNSLAAKRKKKTKTPKRKYAKRSKRELTLREVVKAFSAERDDLTRMINRLEGLL